MKGLKLSLVVLTATLLALGLSGMAYAFHSGGVAECGGCHSMHAPKVNAPSLLLGTDASSTCLNCHMHAGDTGPSSYHILTADVDAAARGPLQRTPGGDFGWTRRTYNYILRGTATTELGQTHGHNVVASDFGLTVDTDNPTSPGGNFPSGNLACTSCHNPHGKYRRLSDGTIATTGAPIIASGSYDNSLVPASGQAVGVYRLLQGNGSIVNGVTFLGVPAAVAPSTYNRTEAVTQTRVAYGVVAGAGNETWGLWCATCHAGMHTSTATGVVHPIDQTFSTPVLNNYNQYKGSGNMTGTNADSYLSLVPFIEGVGSTYASLALDAKNDGSRLGGATSTSLVSCVSCHRAHASGFKDMLRWNNEGEFIIVNGSWPGTDSSTAAAQNVSFSQGRTYLEMKGAYYEYPESKFATYQRVLCNKCHAQD
jgi:hypothetical protein